MPIYGYRCSSCGLEKDVMQKMSDAPLTDCPSCNAPTFTKQLSAAGFQLKGSGWYATDFKGGAKPAAKAEGSAAAAAAVSDAPAKAADSSPPSTPCGGSCACH